MKARAEVLAIRLGELGIAHRDGPVGRALENGELANLAGDGLDHLDAGGAGADDAHPLAGEVDALLRPAAGVENLPLEALMAREWRHQRRRQPAGAGEQELGAQPLTAFGDDLPALAGFVEVRRGDPRVELNVLAQIALVGDEVEIALGLRLGGKTLAPTPLFRQFL